MSIVLKNNASDFLAAAIDSSQTSITLQSAASFPTLAAGEYFYGTLEDTAGQIEIVKVTARVGTILTVVRAQEGTSAASFAQGSRFEARVTAQSVLDVVDTKIDVFTGTGSQTIFNLSFAPRTQNAIQIYINGVYQRRSTYSVTGNTVTFSEAPPVTSSVEANYI